jgi:hypothetical protein
MEEHRLRAEALVAIPVSRTAATVIVAVWIMAAVLAALWLTCWTGMMPDTAAMEST